MADASHDRRAVVGKERSEGTAGSIQHDPTKLDEVGADDRDPGSQRLEQLVRARQSVIQRDRLDRHVGQIGARDPRRQLAPGHGREEVDSFGRSRSRASACSEAAADRSP